MQTYASSHPIFREEKEVFKEPPANYSFLPLVVLYYAHAVVEAGGAIELLKLKKSLPLFTSEIKL